MVLTPAAHTNWRQLYPSLIFKNASVCALIKGDACRAYYCCGWYPINFTISALRSRSFLMKALNWSTDMMSTSPPSCLIFALISLSCRAFADSALRRSIIALGAFAGKYEPIQKS